MEAKAHLKYVRISPRKVQIVLDLIRGKDTETAMAILKNSHCSLCIFASDEVKYDLNLARRNSDIFKMCFCFHYRNCLLSLYCDFLIYSKFLSPHVP